MSELLTLPPNPFPMSMILPEDVARLEKRHPSIPRTAKHCPTCSGRGIFRWRDQNGDPASYECDCKSQVVLTRYLTSCGLGRQHQRMCWDDVTNVPQEALDAVLAYAEQIDFHINSGMGLVLRSPANGTGKTMLAVLLLKMILSKGHDGYFVAFHDLLDMKAAGWSNTDDQDYFIRRVRNAGVLVIDDVGKENVAAGERALGMHQSTFDQVLRARYADCRPTILTTNMTEKWWSDHYQPAIMSILTGSTSTVEVDGLPWRDNEKIRRDEETRLGLTRPLVMR